MDMSRTSGREIVSGGRPGGGRAADRRGTRPGRRIRTVAGAGVSVLCTLAVVLSLASPALASVSESGTAASVGEQSSQTTIAATLASTAASATTTTSSAYAVFSGTTLTLYYDASSSSRSGTVYSISSSGYSSASAVPWYSVRTSVKTVTAASGFQSFMPTSTAYWFYGMTALTTVNNLSYVNMANVTTVAYMFYNCKVLSSGTGGASYWYTGSITDFSYLFYNCKSVSSFSLTGWLTASAQKMSYMFYGCSSVTKLNLHAWNTSNVTTMAYMFYGMSSLTTIYASGNWSTDSVNSASCMFYGCKNLVGGNGTAYNASYVGIGRANNDNSSSKGYLTYKASPTRYYLTLSANGGTTQSPSSMKLVSGHSYRLPATTSSRTGYTFKGWGSSSSATSASWSSGGTISISAAKTICALWTANTYYIAFDVNGGTSTTRTTLTCAYGTSCTFSVGTSECTRTGYTFAGWATSASASAAAYTAGSSYTLSNLISTAGATVTFYAVWTANSYTVRFCPQDGSFSDGSEYKDQTLTYGSEAYLTSAASMGLSRTGYSFSGWAISASATAASYADGASVANLTSTAGATVCLYALWTANSYTVSFDANGGTGQMDSIDCAFGVATALTECTFERTGYTFSGWSLSSSATSSTYADGESVTDLSSTDGATVTLYAVWEANTYYIAFNSNGGTGSMTTLVCTYDESVTLTACAFEMTGHTFAGWGSWYLASAPSFADGETVVNLTSTAGATVTLFAVWEANAYTVVLDANGGEGDSEAIECTYGEGVELPACPFTRDGYVFAGWSTDADATGATYADAAQTGDLADEDGATVMLYAIWRAVTYTVSFDANASDATGEMDAVEWTFGEEHTAPACSFARTSAAFAGWSCDADADEADYLAGDVVGDLATTEGAEVVLYALWCESDYTIVYDANGGDGEMAETAASTQAAVTLSSCTFTLTGYSCATTLTWNTAADGSGTSYADGETVEDLSADGSDVTLYAQWTANTYEIAFAPNGGSGTMGTLSCTYGEDVTLTACAFTRSSFTFAGWATTSTATTAKYADGATVTNLTATDGATVTLYAVWRAKTYTIKFSANGGSGSMASIEVSFGASRKLASCSFTRSGYVFKNWNTKAGGGGTSYADGATVKNLATATTTHKTVTLYAQWKAKSAQTLALAKSSRKTRTVSAVKLAKKRKVTVKGLKVTGAKTTLTYKLAGVWVGSSTLYSDGIGGKVKVNARTGAVTLSRGLSKGTYRLRIKASAKAGTSCKAASRTFTLRVRVK